MKGITGEDQERERERFEDFYLYYWGFPGSSAGKELACNAGDPGLISGSGRSPGEGIDYPLQYSWASLMAQMVKNLLADLDLILGSERSPGGGHGNPLQYSCLGESPWTEEPGGPQSMEWQRVGHD